MPFITDPPDCPVTYTYSVSPPAAQDVVSFDESTRTFTFFNDQDVSIASSYDIMITGDAGTVSTFMSSPPPFIPLTVKNPCEDTNYVSI